MRFELSHDRRAISDDAILDDMRRVAESLASPVLRQREYREHGKYGVRTAINRFGSWACAVESACLEKSVDRQIADSQLFENLLYVWTQAGGQPAYSDVQKPVSTYHISTYTRRFGSWRSALDAFVEWANATEAECPSDKSQILSTEQQKTPRQPSLRMRFRVLNRDRFSCKACGNSPATSPGVKLQVDHIVPWSKGGETVDDNLQTLCEECNEGKSDEQF